MHIYAGLAVPGTVFWMLLAPPGFLYFEWLSGATRKSDFSLLIFVDSALWRPRALSGDFPGPPAGDWIGTTYAYLHGSRSMHSTIYAYLLDSRSLLSIIYSFLRRYRSLHSTIYAFLRRYSSLHCSNSAFLSQSFSLHSSTRSFFHRLSLLPICLLRRFGPSSSSISPLSSPH